MAMGRILGGAPLWVYILLAFLIVIGIRRLRDRDMPSAVAFIPVVAFLAWGLVGASSYAKSVGWAVAALAWLGGALIGGVSATVIAEPRGIRLPEGRVRQPGSWMPLISYLLVFVARFACGAWAAIDPAHAALANGLGVAAGAVMTARLIIAVARWRTAPVATAASSGTNSGG